MADLRVAILTCSDSRFHGAEDHAGRALIDLCEERSWDVVAYHVCPDDRECIGASLIEMCDADEANVVLTSGGTALGPRDVTPDATIDITEREIPGISEAIRRHLAATSSAMILTRAACAQRGNTLIVNLPGGEENAREGFTAVADQLETAVRMISGRGNT